MKLTTAVLIHLVLVFLALTAVVTLALTGHLDGLALTTVLGITGFGNLGIAGTPAKTSPPTGG